MKKKNLVIVSVLVVVAIVIIAIFFPPADESGSAGTIGKVDKYRNTKTDQDKIVLRNVFLKDSTALLSVINLLQINENYLTTLPKEFKEWETSLKSITAKDEKLKEQFNQLNQLAVFMNNNISTIANTRKLLTKYYTKDTLDMSIDVQNDLIQFDTFITNLNERSKVFDSLFTNINGMVNEQVLAKLTSTKQEAEKLKEIREKMLGTIILCAVTLNNDVLLNTALSCTILNGFVLNKQLNGGYTAVYGAKEGGNKLNVLLNSKALNGVLLNKNLGIIYTAKDNLSAQALECMNLGLVSDFFNCKSLGIIELDNKFVFAVNAKDNLGINAKNGLEAITNNAKVFCKMGMIPDHLAAL
ncbi:MAG: hypothetical protein V1773_17445 [bacterium]